MIRIRDANENGIINCCSCNKRTLWKHVDAGHFLPAHRRATCFNEKNVHGQCKPCNLNMNDPCVLAPYTKFMVDNYGQKTVDQMMILSRMKSGYDAHSLQQIGFESLYAAEKMHLEKFGNELVHRLVDVKKYKNWKNKL